MKKYIKYPVLILLFIVPWTFYTKAQNDSINYQQSLHLETINQDKSPLQLTSPANIVDTVEYDPETNEYIFSKKIGPYDYQPSSRLTFEEYKNYQFEQSLRSYWRQRAKGESLDDQTGLFPNLRLGGEAFDKLLGSSVINIIPMGSAELIFGVNINSTEDPTIAENLRKTTTFDFEEKIMMNVTGTIGDKIKLGVNYNTEATFDFENQTKLEYIGKEDEIIKRIEAGNVTLPLPGSLITGSQSLFGIKTELQFGRLTVSSVFSQQKGETKVIEVKGGAQTQYFELKADEYDANRHFFLSQYFKDNYNKALEELPVIKSPYTITKVEVWVTNKANNNEENRNVLALLDLAESGENVFAQPEIINPASFTSLYPSNNTNELYNKVLVELPERNFNNINNALASWSTYNYLPGQDYEKIGSARKLKPNEYELNEQLGYISLNTALNADEILAVAYEYDIGGQRYQVGDFSTDGITSDEFLIAKLLKGTNLTPSLPNWDLMMKNVYAIGAYQVNKEDFVLDILYQDDKTGNALNYIPEGKINKQILLKVLNLDNLNSQNDAIPDGRFDFINGITINASNGRVIFPVLQPFGEYLRKQFGDSEAEQRIADDYVFQELYDTTLTYARLVADKNKFKLRGEYKSASSSDIALNAFNIPQGSVVVTSGGRKLTENIDYTVDYNLGRVKIINEGLLESGTPLQISLESQALYSIQTKTLIGTHLNYQFSDNFNMGATIMNLTERPLTQKVAFGEEPISNTIWGLNTSYRTESQLITSLVDRLPFLETKETSSIMFDAEFAHLIPGHSKAIAKEGNAYIDDFEGSETSLDLKSFNTWVIASAPQGQPGIFPEASLSNDLAYGKNRAKIAWYKIDPLFLRNNSLTPGHIKTDAEQQSNHFVREIYEKEIFPNKESETTVPTALQVLNVAYYPKERGPYNYDDGSNPTFGGINPDGTLRDPDERWGGIMRELPTTDFEAANVEYVEFWLMDPFVYDSTNINDGGSLYINLGNVSEDILRDSRKSFEDGLPDSEDISGVDTTVWGRVPSNDFTVEAFDVGRENQDVGLDGLKNDDEQSFFEEYLENLESVLTQEALDNFNEDPSADDYHYYRGGDYDAQQLTILERYKNYNGMEGNSTGEASEIATKRPDTEDINRDKTLSETESYFQYKVELKPELMEIGQNYIVDKKKGHNVNLPNGEKNADITWYQFRIPIREPEKTIGGIQDFKSIRFMRMFFKEFSDSIILRFAKFDLVRGEWRKYNLSLMEGQEGLSTPELSNGTLDISSVNIEENDNYVLPPGVDRVIDPTNPQLRQLNEQSMVLRVRNLDDGDARSAYKTINMDMREYEKLKMFVHAEALENEILEDDDLRVFVRLGTDYKNNYYEYEIPIKVTQPGNYGDLDRLTVWPEENNVEIILNELVQVKQARNDQMRQANSSISPNAVYSVYKDNKKRLSVRGNPNLSNVVTIMIGVRNPSKQNNIISTDDGMPKSGEIWVNELRLTDFKEEGGWAARGRLSARLADLGMINLSGNISTPGFGSIEKKVNERSKEEVIEYDVSTNLDLGKFFSDDAQVSIPMYAGYSESFINPEYNPLDPDIPLDDAIKNADSKAEKDSIKNVAQDYTRRKSLNFTNVRINKRSEKPRIYDPANFSISYSYYEVYARDINTEYDVLKNYRGSFSYIYNTRPKTITPFRRSQGILNWKALALIKDFNFNYMPSSFSFRTDMYRKYQSNKTRNIYSPGIIIEPTFDKEFVWNRNYDLQWDITRSLKLDFSATNIARIDEPYGEVNKHHRDTYEHWRDSVWNNILNFGRNTQYHHNINATYRVPINKIPLLDWTSVNARYNATYNWDAGPMLKKNSEYDLGNNIRNSNTIQLNGQANMVNLYNKAGFLKRINQKYGRGRSKETEYEDVSYEEKDVWFREGRSRSIYHELMTEDITRVAVTDSEGEDVKGEWEVVSKRRIRFRSDKDIDNGTIVVEGRTEKKENPLIFIAENTARLLMSVKNISVSYTITEGSSMPGYKPSTNLLGMETVNNVTAPGWPYILGWQQEDFALKAIQNGWYTQDTTLNKPYLMTHNENLNIRVTLEPVRGLKIDLTANRSYSENNNRYYMPTLYGTEPYNQQINGNFSMTYLTIGSAFEELSSSDNYYSASYENFKSYRIAISQRLGKERQNDPFYSGDESSDEPGYMDGYGSLSQQVMGPAFLAAYGYYDENNVPLELFHQIPLPNWSIRYDGLKDIPFIKRFFRSFNLSHTYRSSYSVGSFINNADYEEEDGYSYVIDQLNNFIPQYQVNSITINEQFSPLINVDMTMNNNLTARFEMKKNRTVTLSFTNNQVTEVLSEEFGVSVGYRFDDFNLIFDFGNQQENFKSDLNIRGNFKIRDNKTILRKVVEDDELPSAGQKATIIGVSADYMLSNRLTLRLFYDQNISDPLIGNAYRTSNTDIGFSLRFTLTE
ncbi:MAG TPA: cell surface protein SprA [Bacteroidales bacterium]|nr:cell surface protein SprA [Bacteroidales bacterium]